MHRCSLNGTASKLSSNNRKGSEDRPCEGSASHCGAAGDVALRYVSRHTFRGLLSLLFRISSAMAAQSPRVQDIWWKVGLLYDFRFEKARLGVPAIFECFRNITSLQRFRHFGSPHSHRAFQS